MKTPEQKRKNREYMRGYRKLHPYQSRDWGRDNPEGKRKHEKKYIFRHLTKERKCIICGSIFQVISPKSESENLKACKKTCSEKCRKIYYGQQQRKWQKEHPDRVKKTAIEGKQNCKFSVMAIYSEGQPKCACCGETEITFLTIDHINNDGAKQRRGIFGNRIIGGYAFYSWIIKNDFPTDLQVLCMNCQFGRKFNNGICPHSFNQVINYGRPL